LRAMQKTCTSSCEQPESLLIVPSTQMNQFIYGTVHYKYRDFWVLKFLGSQSVKLFPVDTPERGSRERSFASFLPLPLKHQRTRRFA
jgi:hypothetical protein